MFYLISCNKIDKLRWNLVSSPEVSSLMIENNSLSQFQLIANFSSNGYDNDAEMGFCFSSNNELPTINDDLIFLGKNKTGMQKVIKQWSNSNPIYCRAFIINKIDTVYSNSLLVTWPGGEQNKPIVILNSSNEFSFYWVKVFGEITSNGGLPITSEGFQICKESSFVGSSLQTISLITNAFSFNETIENLEENTGYFVRAFASNISGTSYSSYNYFVTKNFYDVGEIGPAGGIIFYNKIDTVGGWNFLECSPLDVTSLKYFSPNNELTYIMGLETGVGKGSINTTKINNSIGNLNTAAMACETYTLNGYSDWFLPSRDELIKIYQNVFLINSSSFNSTKYWSSSQDEGFTQNAWVQNMNQSQSMSGTYTELKSSLNRVRPIRCF